MFVLDILKDILGAVRGIFLTLDSIGLTFIDDIYDLLISAVTAFDGQAIAEIANKMAKNAYIIVGIFALFRIALILVNAMINPDKLTDGKEGVPNVLAKLLITVVLLVATPMLFSASRDIQGFIMDNNYISKLIIGTNLTSQEGGGKYMKDVAVRSIIKPDSRLAKINDKTGQYDPKPECDNDCKNAIAAWNNSVDFLVLEANIGVYSKVGSENVYVYRYTPFVTLAIGLFISYVLLSFTIDISVRTLELLVLEILSPLFIVTYIDPKSSKSGPFSKWLQACGKTYLSLFIKIAVVCFMLFFISHIDTLMGSQKDGGMLKLLMLVAILIFAKKMPGWISGMLGGSGDDGLGGLGIGKKLGGMALVGGLATKGIDSAKKAASAKAKVSIARKANKLGADVGGSIGGIRAARHNAQGDKSYRSIRENDGRIAVAKSFFNDADRAARKKANKDVEAFNAAKQGRLDAKAQGLKAALDGKFISPLNLSQGVQSTFDPNFKNHKQILQERADEKATKHLTGENSGFDMLKINKAKDLANKVQTASMLTNQKCYGDDDGVVRYANGGSPVVFNGKTLKDNYGVAATSFEDMAAISLGKGNKGAFISDGNFQINGTTIGAGCAVIPNKDANGNITSYETKTKKEVSDEADRIKGGYTSQGQAEMDAIFAERKSENVGGYIQTLQNMNAASQDAATISTGLSNIENELQKLRLQQSEAKDSTEKAAIGSKISEREADYLSLEASLKKQQVYQQQLEEQAKVYTGPTGNITINDSPINLANAGSLQQEQEKIKEKKRKIADEANPTSLHKDDKK